MTGFASHLRLFAGKMSSSDFSTTEPTIAAEHVPSDHFLAQRPISPRPPTPADPTQVDTSSLAAADFDVSVESGFLPPQEPVQSLAHLGPAWRELELCLQAAADEVQQHSGGAVGKLSDRFRRRVANLPTVDTSLLTTLPLLRRAHTLLAHVTHYYMHSSFPSQTVVPAALAVPLVYTSDKLGLPPILTYADTVLWVWKLIDPTQPLRADNVDISTNFTTSSSERAFFLLSLFCELHGPAILRLMSSTLDEAFFADRVALSRIATYLRSIALLIDELKTLMHDAIKGEFGPPPNRQTILPGTFYWEIRPWFNGGKWTYERAGPDGQDIELEFGGPSAGQSSLVHAIDIFLGVDHAPRPSPSNSASQTKSGGLSDSTFMQRMSAYMPHHHRSFLEHLVSIHNPTEPTSSSIPSLRTLALRHPTLQPAYDAAVESMKKFRDTHIILATHFIVAQARHPPAIDSVHFQEWEAKRLMKEQAEIVRRREESAIDKKEEVVVGTGGTDLSSFLKLCRDRTKEALIASTP
ncbi:dioxygenase BNA2 [Sporobolomyces koalae]|uniref:dioxygenase BNA2 n=1 Tax=Sporobolomyces koalae TaxID=500713 RepID=UPI00317ABD94